MTNRTACVLVFGPSGIGKSALNELFREDVFRIEPHRVRDAPRDSNDTHYLSRMAHAGILSLIENQEAQGPFGGALDIKIYSRLALFKARGEDQVLFLPDPCASFEQRKVELFGPVFREFLDLRGRLSWIDGLLEGTVYAILLNPWEKSLFDVDPRSASNPASKDGQVLVNLLKNRGEKPASIEKRVTNIVEELSAWRSIAAAADDKLHVLEAPAWPYAEYTYPQIGDPGRKVRLQQAENALLGIAKTRLTHYEDFALFANMLEREVVAADRPPVTDSLAHVQERPDPDSVDANQEWTIYFACTRPGQPGCGCPDNDFLGEHRFRGTRQEAEAGAQRISWEIYAGDFQWWVEPTTAT